MCLNKHRVLSCCLYIFLQLLTSKKSKQKRVRARKPKLNQSVELGNTSNGESINHGITFENGVAPQVSLKKRGRPKSTSHRITIQTPPTLKPKESKLENKIDHSTRLHIDATSQIDCNRNNANLSPHNSCDANLCGGKTVSREVTNLLQQESVNVTSTSKECDLMPVRMATSEVFPVAPSRTTDLTASSVIEINAYSIGSRSEVPVGNRCRLAKIINNTHEELDDDESKHTEEKILTHENGSEHEYAGTNCSSEGSAGSGKCLEQAIKYPGTGLEDRTEVRGVTSCNDSTTVNNSLHSSLVTSNYSCIKYNSLNNNKLLTSDINTAYKTSSKAFVRECNLPLCKKLRTRNNSSTETNINSKNVLQTIASNDGGGHNVIKLTNTPGSASTESMNPSNDIGLSSIKVNIDSDSEPINFNSEHGSSESILQSAGNSLKSTVSISNAGTNPTNCGTSTQCSFGAQTTTSAASIRHVKKGMNSSNVKDTFRDKIILKTTSGQKQALSRIRHSLTEGNNNSIAKIVLKSTVSHGILEDEPLHASFKTPFSTNGSTHERLASHQILLTNESSPNKIKKTTEGKLCQVRG